MIVVTGGAGFIGTNLVRELIKLNKEVLIVEELDKYSSKFKNIDSLEIVDCIGHDTFLKPLHNGKYSNKFD